MKKHLQFITQLVAFTCVSLAHLYAQTVNPTDVQIQQAIGNKQYAQAAQLVNAALAKLSPKQPTQRRQYGTYQALNAEINFRQKNYEEAVSQASEAGDILKKYPVDVTSVKNQTLLMYAGLLDDGDEPGVNNKKIETLFLSSLAEKNIPKLYDTYMAMGNESGKTNAWTLAMTFYSSASQLPGILQDPVRGMAVRSKMTTTLAQINQRENEEEDEENEADEKRKNKQPIPAKKKAQRVNNHE